MALPQLTPEQRAEALKKAAEARKARAELREKLKRGGTDLQQVLKDAETDPILGKMKVSALLVSLPKVGKIKAEEIMNQLEIAPTRRLRGPIPASRLKPLGRSRSAPAERDADGRPGRADGGSGRSQADS